MITINSIFKAQDKACPNCKPIQNPAPAPSMNTLSKDTLQLSSLKFKGEQEKQEIAFDDVKPLLEKKEELNESEKKQIKSLLKGDTEEKIKLAEAVTDKSGIVKNEKNCSYICGMLSKDPEDEVRMTMVMRAGNLKDKHPDVYTNIIKIFSKDPITDIKEIAAVNISENREMFDSEMLKDVQEDLDLDKNVKAMLFEPSKKEEKEEEEK